MHIQTLLCEQQELYFIRGLIVSREGWSADAIGISMRIVELEEALRKLGVKYIEHDSVY